MGPHVDYGPLPYLPSLLRLSEGMKRRIAAGEVNEHDVRSNTSRMIGLVAGLPSDKSGFFSAARDHLLNYPALVGYYDEHHTSIDKDARCDDGNALFAYAVERGCMPIIQKLLADGVRLEELDSEKNDALMIAMRHCAQHYPLHEMLLQHGCDPERTNKRNYNSITSALFGHRADQLTWLLSKGIDAESATIECNPADAFYPGWIDLGSGVQSARYIVNALIHHYDDQLIDLQYTDSGERFREITSEQRQCHAILRQLDTSRTRWNQFEITPDVTQLRSEDLIGFANIGKRDEMFNIRYWHGHESLAATQLGALPPYLARHVLESQPWLTNILADLSAPAKRWTERLADAPPNVVAR